MSDPIAAGPDLLDFVDGDCAINEILRWDPRVPKLAMIGVKRAAKDPGATLSSPRLRTLLEELRQRYKFIVLNTAPILPVRDVKLLASQADEVLMIAHWAQTQIGRASSSERVCQYG